MGHACDRIARKQSEFVNRTSVEKSNLEAIRSAFAEFIKN
jgi:hypothetical protein